MFLILSFCGCGVPLYYFSEGLSTEPTSRLVRQTGLWHSSSMVSCQKGPTHHAYAWQDTLELSEEKKTLASMLIKYRSNTLVQDSMQSGLNNTEFDKCISIIIFLFFQGLFALLKWRPSNWTQSSFPFWFCVVWKDYIHGEIHLSFCTELSDTDMRWRNALITTK